MTALALALAACGGNGSESSASVTKQPETQMLTKAEQAQEALAKAKAHLQELESKLATATDENSKEKPEEDTQADLKAEIELAIADVALKQKIVDAYTNKDIAENAAADKIAADKIVSDKTDATKSAQADAAKADADQVVIDKTKELDLAIEVAGTTKDIADQAADDEVESKNIAKVIAEKAADAQTKLNLSNALVTAQQNLENASDDADIQALTKAVDDAKEALRAAGLATVSNADLKKENEDAQSALKKANEDATKAAEFASEAKQIASEDAVKVETITQELAIANSNAANANFTVLFYKAKKLGSNEIQAQYFAENTNKLKSKEEVQTALEILAAKEGYAGPEGWNFGYAYNYSDINSSSDNGESGYIGAFGDKTTLAYNQKYSVVIGDYVTDAKYSSVGDDEFIESQTIVMKGLKTAAAAIPTLGTATYEGKAFQNSGSNNGQLTYNVDFTNRLGDGTITGLGNEIELKTGLIDGNTIKSVAEQDQQSGYYELGFFGKAAEEIAGKVVFNGQDAVGFGGTVQKSK